MALVCSVPLSVSNVFFGPKKFHHFTETCAVVSTCLRGVGSVNTNCDNASRMTRKYNSCFDAGWSVLLESMLIPWLNSSANSLFSSSGAVFMSVQRALTVSYGRQSLIYHFCRPGQLK